MESWKGNAKRGCGGWMEECGRGAAVEQLTARGMLSIPAMGAIAVNGNPDFKYYVSIPAMGGNRPAAEDCHECKNINPRNGGQ